MDKYSNTQISFLSGLSAVSSQASGQLFVENIKFEKQRTNKPYPTIYRSLINHGGQNPIEAAKLGCKIIYGPSFSNFTEIYKKLDNMKVSTMFKNYRQGTKIIENLIHKKHFVFDNKKLMKYGEKILSLTYLKITKLI